MVKWHWVLKSWVCDPDIVDSFVVDNEEGVVAVGACFFFFPLLGGL